MMEADEARQAPIDRELIRFTLARMGLMGHCSHVLSLDLDVLTEACVMLATPGVAPHEVLRWLASQGRAGRVGRSSFYRFVRSFDAGLVATWSAFARHAALDVLTVREVADRLRVTPKAVRRLVARGELHAVRIGQTIRVPGRSFQSFVIRGNPVVLEG